MKIIKYYKLELNLNKNQETICKKSSGVSRFAYNWKLSSIKQKYDNAKIEQNVDKPKVKLGSAIDWHKEWVLLKDELPWIRETSKCCGQEALRNLEKAFKYFFSKKFGYPKFKKRNRKDSFYLDGQIFISSNYVQLPRIGKVRLKEKCYPIIDGKKKLSQATVSRQADRWFVSFFLREDECPKLSQLNSIENDDIIGIDLGIKELAITSDGQTFENPKAYSKHLKNLKKYQRRMSRKQKDSNNKKKATKKVAKLNKKISDIRNDSIHKMTTSIVKTKPKMIVIETLKPKNMSKNHKLAASVLDAAFGKTKDTFRYKSLWNGIHLIQAPMFYASSKYCSCCGHKNIELKLSDREWDCKNCGQHLDRDVNAAKNLKYFGLWMLDKHLDESPTTVSSTECQACGDERLQFFTEQCSSMKQEFRNSCENMNNYSNGHNPSKKKSLNEFCQDVLDDVEYSL